MKEKKPILVGHKNYSESSAPFVYRERVFGLDTSCVTGKALTGLLLPAFRFVSVPSRKNHWESLRREYADQMRTELALPQEPVWSAKEDERLEYLIQVIVAATDTRLRALQADPSYADLRPRQQAKRFESGLAEPVLVILMQLARLGKLNLESVRRIVKRPDQVDDLILACQANGR